MQLTEGHGSLLRNGPLSISRRLKRPPNPYVRTDGGTDGRTDFDTKLIKKKAGINTGFKLGPDSREK